MDTNPPPSPSPSPSSSMVSAETLTKAVEALLQWKDTKSQSSNPQLLPQDDFVYLILTLKKIPSKGRTNPYKIPLPNPLQGPGSELCLVFDDRSKSNLEKKDAKAKLEADDLTGFVTKLLRLSKLKSDYRPFEAKRKLCDSYDMFLADQRVIPMLPKLLGKHFFQKKKIPVPVNLMHKNWKEQIERVCGSALMYLRTGTCSVIKVARGSMEKEDIVNNVAAAIEGAVGIVEKKWENVRSLHLKFSESVALPVYQALPEIKLRIDGAEEEMAKVEKTEKKSQGKRDENSGKKVSKKGRIGEVRYMDNKVDAVNDDLTDAVNDDLTKVAGKKRKSKEKIVEMSEGMKDGNSGKKVSKKGKKSEEKIVKMSEGKKDENSGKKLSKKGRIRDVRSMDNKVDDSTKVKGKKRKSVAAE